MRYEKYENRMQVLGKILKTIYKRRFPIIIASSIIFATGAALFSTSGILGDVTVGENVIEYGNKFEISGDAFIAKTTNEYFVNGVWTTKEPTSAGTYIARVRSKNNFGAYYYSEEYEFTILRKAANLTLVKNQYVEYGSLPRVNTEDLVEGDHIETFEAIYDSFASLSTTCEIDLSTLVILNSKNEDVTDSYILTTEPEDINFKTKRLDLRFDGAEKIYDGKSLSNEEINSSELAFEDYIDTSVLNHPVATEVGVPVSNKREPIIIRNKNGDDVTHLYNIYSTSGELLINKRYIKASSNSINKVYDGKAFSSSSFKYTLEGDSLLEGDRIVNLHYDNINDTNFCLKQNTFSFSIVDQFNNDVTNTHYNVSYYPGEFRIDKRPINISYNNSKSYDGYDLVTSFPETDDSYILDESTLASGHTVEVTYKYDTDKDNVHVFVRDGVPTLIFNIYDEHRRKVTDNYDITFDTEHFEVEKRKLSLCLFDQTKYYDGNSDYSSIPENKLYSVAGLASSDTYTISPLVFVKQTSSENPSDVGKHIISFDKTKPISIYNNIKGVDVTNDYDISFENKGEANYIVKAPLIDINFNLGENSEYFKYKFDFKKHTLQNLLYENRFEFTTDNEDGRRDLGLYDVLAPGDEVVIENDFNQLNVGCYNVTPTIKIRHNGIDVSNNYKINNSRTYEFEIIERALDLKFTGSFNNEYCNRYFGVDKMFENGEYDIRHIEFDMSEFTISVTQYNYFINVSDSGKEVQYSINISCNGTDVTSNFCIQDYDYTFFISPRVIDIELDPEDFTVEYADKDYYINDILQNYIRENKPSCILSEHQLYFNQTSSFHDVSDSGKIAYSFGVMDENGKNVTENYKYSVSSHPYYFEILPRDIDIQFNPDEFEFTYDGEDHSLAALYENGLYISDSTINLVSGHNIEINTNKVINVSDSGKAYYSISVYKLSKGIKQYILPENYNITYYDYTYKVNPLEVEVKFVLNSDVDEFYNPAGWAKLKNTVVDETNNTITYTYDGYNRDINDFLFTYTRDGATYNERSLYSVIASGSYVDQNLSIIHRSGSTPEYNETLLGYESLYIRDSNGQPSNENYTFDLNVYTVFINRRPITIEYDNSYFDNWHFDGHTYSALEAWENDLIWLNVDTPLANNSSLTISGWEKKYRLDTETDLEFNIYCNGEDVTSFYCINGSDKLVLPEYADNKTDFIFEIDNSNGDLFDFVYDGRIHSIRDYYLDAKIEAYPSYNGNRLPLNDFDGYFSKLSQYNAVSGYEEKADEILTMCNDEKDDLNDEFNFVFKYKDSEETFTSIFWNIHPREIVVYIPTLNSESLNEFVYDGIERGSAQDWVVEGELADFDFVYVNDNAYDSLLDAILEENIAHGAIANHGSSKVWIDSSCFVLTSKYYYEEFSQDNYNIKFIDYDVVINRAPIDIEFTTDFSNLTFDGETRNFLEEYLNGNYTQDNLTGNTIAIETYRCDSLGDNVVAEDVSFGYVYNPFTGESDNGYYIPHFTVTKEGVDITDNYEFAKHVYNVQISKKDLSIDFANFDGSENYFTWIFDNTAHSFADIINMPEFEEELAKVGDYELVVTNEPTNENYTGYKYVGDCKDGAGTIVPAIGLFKDGYDYAGNFNIPEITYEFDCSPFDLYVYFDNYGNVQSYEDEETKVSGGLINVSMTYGSQQLQDKYGNAIGYSLPQQFHIDANECDIDSLNLDSYELLFYSQYGKYEFTNVSDFGIAYVNGLKAINDDGEIAADNFVIHGHKLNISISPRTLFTNNDFLEFVTTPIEYSVAQHKSVFTELERWGTAFQVCESIGDYFDENCFPVTDDTDDYDGQTAWSSDFKIYRDIVDASGTHAIDVSENYYFHNDVMCALPCFKFELKPVTLNFYIDESNFDSVTATATENVFDASFEYDGKTRSWNLYTLDEETIEMLEELGVTVTYKMFNATGYACEYINDNPITFDISSAITLWRDGVDVTSSGEFLIKTNVYNVTVTRKAYDFDLNAFAYAYFTTENNEFTSRSLLGFYEQYLLSSGLEYDAKLAEGDYMEITDVTIVPNAVGNFSVSATIKIKNASGSDVTNSYLIKYITASGSKVDTCPDFVGRYSTIEFVLNTNDSRLIKVGEEYQIAYDGADITAIDLYKVKVTFVSITGETETYYYDIEEYFSQFEETKNIDWKQYFNGSFTFSDYIGSRKEFGFDAVNCVGDTSLDSYFYLNESESYYITFIKRSLSFDSSLGSALDDGFNNALNPIQVLFNGDSYGYSIIENWESLISTVYDYNQYATGDIVFTNGTSLANGDVLVFYSNGSPIYDQIMYPGNKTAQDYYTSANECKVYRYVGSSIIEVTDRYDIAEFNNYYFEILPLEIREHIAEFDEILIENGTPNGTEINVPYTGKTYSVNDYTLEFKDVDGNWYALDLYDETISSTGLVVIGERLNVNRMPTSGGSLGYQPESGVSEVNETSSRVTFSPRTLLADINGYMVSLTNEGYVTINQKEYSLKIMRVTIDIKLNDDYVDFIYDGLTHSIQNAIDDLDENNFTFVVKYDGKTVSEQYALQDYIDGLVGSYNLYAENCKSFKRVSDLGGNEYVNEIAHYVIKDSSGNVVDEANFSLNDSPRTYTWKIFMPEFSVISYDLSAHYGLDSNKYPVVQFIDCTFDGELHGLDSFEFVINGFNSDDISRLSYNSIKGSKKLDITVGNFTYSFNVVNNESVRNVVDTIPDRALYLLIDWTTFKVYNNLTNAYESYPYEFVKYADCVSYKILPANYESNIFDDSYFTFVYDGEERSFNDYIEKYCENTLKEYFLDNYGFEITSFFASNDNYALINELFLTKIERSDKTKNVADSGKTVSPCYHIMGHYVDSPEIEIDFFEDNINFKREIYVYKIIRRSIDIVFDNDAFTFIYDGEYHSLDTLFTDGAYYYNSAYDIIDGQIIVIDTNRYRDVDETKNGAGIVDTFEFLIYEDGEDITYNYDFTSTYSHTYMFNILPRPLDIVFDSDLFNITYDGTRHYLSDYVDLATFAGEYELVKGDKLYVVEEGNGFQYVSESGKVEYYFEILRDNEEQNYVSVLSNYDLTESLKHKYAFNISKADLYLVPNIDLYDKIDGETISFIYDGVERGINFYVSDYDNGLAKSDVILTMNTKNTVKYVDDSREKIGVILDSILIRNLDDGRTFFAIENYNINITEYTFKVLPRPVDFDYNDFFENTNLSSFTFEYSSLLSEYVSPYTYSGSDITSYFTNTKVYEPFELFKSSQGNSDYIMGFRFTSVNSCGTIGKVGDYYLGNLHLIIQDPNTRADITNCYDFGTDEFMMRVVPIPITVTTKGATDYIGNTVGYYAASMLRNLVIDSKLAPKIKTGDTLTLYLKDDFVNSIVNENGSVSAGTYYPDFDVTITNKVLGDVSSCYTIVEKNYKPFVIKGAVVTLGKNTIYDGNETTVNRSCFAYGASEDWINIKGTTYATIAIYLDMASDYETFSSGTRSYNIASYLISDRAGNPLNPSDFQLDVSKPVTFSVKKTDLIIKGNVKYDVIDLPVDLDFMDDSWLPNETLIISGLESGFTVYINGIKYSRNTTDYNLIPSLPTEGVVYSLLPTLDMIEIYYGNKNVTDHFNIIIESNGYEVTFLYDLE